VKLDLTAVTAALTAVPQLPEGDWAALAAAVRAQADVRAIGDLGTLYARAVDDHDIDTLVAMFTPDGVFERRGVAAAGADAVRAAYVASFDTYRTMLHTAHPGVVQLPDDDTASSWSHGHAELATKSTLVMASYRYEDELRRVDGRWLFAVDHVHVRRSRRSTGDELRQRRADPLAAHDARGRRLPGDLSHLGDLPRLTGARGAEGGEGLAVLLRTDSSAVASTDSLKPPTASRSMKTLPICIVSGEWAAISVASCTAAGSSPASECTSCTSSARASSAGRFSTDRGRSRCRAFNPSSAP